MTRRRRLHVPDGLYYIALRGNGGRAVFHDADDYGTFDVIVARSLRRNRCRMHAFCWLPNGALMVVQVSDVQVGRFVQQVTAPYAKYVNARHGRTGHVFQHHYRALLVQRSPYLVHLVRYVHRAPVRAGLAARPEEYAWSADRAYRGVERVPWLTTHVTKQLLDRGGAGALSYRDWVSRADDPGVSALFEDGSGSDSRVVGSEAFIATAGDQVEEVRSSGGLDKIIRSVALEHGVSPKVVASPSRRRQHVLVRALIAWRAMETGVATLSEVARQLNRDPSSIWTAVERYRASRPELFPVDDSDP